MFLCGSLPQQKVYFKPHGLLRWNDPISLNLSLIEADGFTKKSSIVIKNSSALDAIQWVMKFVIVIVD